MPDYLSKYKYASKEKPMDPRHAKRLHKHANLTEILIQIEDFFDGLDLYVFKNWFEGEVYKGPEIRRYWVDLTLMYPYKMMPDPQGAMRLIKHGAKVNFSKSLKEVSVPSDMEDEASQIEQNNPESVEEPIWLVSISIPRKFIEELDDDDLELYDDDVDTNDVSDARDENIDQEDALKDGEDAEGEADAAEADEADAGEEEE